MKITKRYKNDENPVLAFEESDKEEMIKVGRKAEDIWYQKWVDLGKNDHGSCCGGKGIEVYFRGRGQRYARPTLIAECDWIQGNVSAQESKDDAIGYLAGYFGGVEVWYSDGYMD